MRRDTQTNYTCSKIIERIGMIKISKKLKKENRKNKDPSTI